MPLRLLAVSHDASLTGAPVVLLSFLRWLRAHARDEVDLDVVLLRGGPLEDAFRSVAPVRVAGPAPAPTVAEVAYRHASAVGPAVAWQAAARARTVRQLARVPRHDVVWLNSVASATALRALGRRRAPKVVTAAHELGRVIDDVPHRDWERLTARTDRFVAGAPAIADALLSRPGLDPTRVVVAPEFIDPAAEPDGRTRATRPDPGAARLALGLPHDAFVVGACGAATWRKGADLFVRLAEDLRRRGLLGPSRRTRLVWVGGGPDEHAELEFELRAAGLGEVVQYRRPSAALGDVLAAFDVVVLPSREDALPLVLLEAGLARRPVVHFDHLGLEGVIGAGCTAAVPFGDTEAMAAVIAGWHDEPRRAEEQAARAAARVAEAFVADVGAPRWWAVVQEVAGRAPRR